MDGTATLFVERRGAELEVVGTTPARVADNGRWAIACATFGLGILPSANVLEQVLCDMHRDPLRAACEWFGPRGLPGIFAVAGPPGVIAGSSAGAPPRSSTVVRCDPDALIVGAVPGPARCGDGWMAMPPGWAVAWGPEDPEVVVDLVRGRTMMFGALADPASVVRAA